MFFSIIHQWLLLLFEPCQYFILFLNKKTVFIAHDVFYTSSFPNIGLKGNCNTSSYLQHRIFRSLLMPSPTPGGSDLRDIRAGNIIVMQLCQV